MSKGKLMGRIFLCLVLSVVSTLLLPQKTNAQVTAEEVRESIEAGVQYLRGQQRNGRWEEYTGYPDGVTALATLALLNAGVKPSDPVIQDALTRLRGIEIKPNSRTYVISLATMVLSLAEPKRDLALIQRNVKWLEDAQIKEDQGKGAWSYSFGGLSAFSADGSNTQFAILALHEAAQAGAVVQQKTWGMAKNYWERTQIPNGSWRYSRGQNATGSMTCAGIAAMIITGENFREEEDTVVGGRVDCCGAIDGEDEIEMALDWYAKAFSVKANPGPHEAIGTDHLFYYLYGMERAGRLSGRRYFGEHDWYREGAEHLLSLQDEFSGSWRSTITPSERNPVIATSMALLFLSKGKRPVVISKYKYGGGKDWNAHRQGVHFLTRQIETAWEQKLNWQVVDSEQANVNDLLTSPIVFVSGQDEFRLSKQQKENLKQYVAEGGFLFVEARNGDGCDGTGFDQDFRKLMVELFPDSSLELLGPDHPVWFSEQKLIPNPDRPLYGLRTCCRTSVIYCPANLSCYWKLRQPSRFELYPADVQKEIQSAVDIGINVVTYATNRELKDKLDRPQITIGDQEDRRLHGVLTAPKLAHGGGADDAPAAWSNQLRVIEEQLEIRVETERQLITADDFETLSRYPLLFMHGRRDFSFSEIERESLRQYLANGGFVFSDAICASSDYAKAFRREFKLLIPDAEFQRLPADHPLLTEQYRGYDVTRVKLNTPNRAGGTTNVRVTETAPILEVLSINGRIAVVFSPYDLSCALENAVSTECQGYSTQDAARIGTNVVLFSLLQ